MINVTCSYQFVEQRSTKLNAVIWGFLSDLDAIVVFRILTKRHLQSTSILATVSHSLFLINEILPFAKFGSSKLNHYCWVSCCE